MNDVVFSLLHVASEGANSIANYSGEQPGVSLYYPTEEFRNDGWRLIDTFGLPCFERHVPCIRKHRARRRHLPDHWRAMIHRHPDAQEPDRARTYRDLVHVGEIAWLGDTGCAGGYHIPMVAFDEPPWDRFLDRPLGRILCPTCRKALSMRHTCGGHGAGGNRTVPLDASEAA